MEALNESGAVPHALQMIDSTVVRAHYRAAGAKWGRTMRRHWFKTMAKATGFWPFAWWLHDQDPPPRQCSRAAHEDGDHRGQTSDHLGFDPVMADNLPTPSILLADRGHDADSIRKSMGKRDVLPVIPMRKSRKRRVGVDRSLCRLRSLVEQCFNKLKIARRIATRYDKTAKSFLGFIDITSIKPLGEPFVNMT